MKAVLLTTAGVLLLLLGSCGGSAAPVQPDEEQPQEQTQPTETPGELPAPVGPEPETPAEPPTSVMYYGASAPVELPLMDPGLYEPNDKQIPNLLFFGVEAGQLLHGTAVISVTSVDDTGTNYIALLIDGEVRTETELSSLTYVWDTTDVEDGHHLMEFIVRDNGNKIGVMTVELATDNSSDWEPPVVTVDVPRCFFDETNYLPVAEYNKRYDYYSWDVAGIIDVEISAEDPSGVRSLVLLTTRYYTIDPDRYTQVTSTPGDSMSLSLDSRDPEWAEWFAVVAEDGAGNRGTTYFGLDTHNTAIIKANYLDANGGGLKDVDVYLMPPGWDSTMTVDLEQATQHETTNSRGHVDFTSVPIGRAWLVARYADETLVTQVITTPDDSYIWVDSELTTFSQSYD